MNDGFKYDSLRVSRSGISIIDIFSSYSNVVLPSTQSMSSALYMSLQLPSFIFTFRNRLIDQLAETFFTFEDSRVLQDLINDGSLSEDMELSDPVSKCPLPASIETGAIPDVCSSHQWHLISNFRKALDGESIETCNRCQERWFNMNLNWTSINDIDEETETRF